MAFPTQPDMVASQSADSYGNPEGERRSRQYLICEHRDNGAPQAPCAGVTGWPEGETGVRYGADARVALAARRIV